MRRYNEGHGKSQIQASITAGGVEVRLWRLALLALALGGVSAVAAWGLYSAISLCSNVVMYGEWKVVHRDAAGHVLGAWILVVPMAGGLVVGLLAKFGSPKIRGHGIPEAMEAVLYQRSRIAPRVAVLKPLSVSIAIGTGGPFGAEGPIIQTGGALGSFVGQVLPLSATERKVLLAAGAAGGMAATFNAPFAAVILAIELLLFEFRARSFLPVVLSVVAAVAVRQRLLGTGAMFEMTSWTPVAPAQLGWYLLLGLGAGGVAVLFSKALYWVEDQFERLPMDPLWWPALGGLGLGVIGYFVPRVLGVGYETISDLLAGHLALSLVVVVFFAKAAALLVSLGSGTSGGLLAPLFTVGAAFGALFASVVNGGNGEGMLSVGLCALAAMTALFGSAARAPITFMIFGFELTRSPHALLPLMATMAAASLVTWTLMEHSVMTEKLARRGRRVGHEAEVDPLFHVTVGDVMSAKPPLVREDEPLSAWTVEGRERSERGAVLVVDDQELLVGVLTRKEQQKSLAGELGRWVRFGEVCSRAVVVAYEDEPLTAVIDRMALSGIGRVPVVSRSNERVVVGYLGRRELLEARRLSLAERQHREPGFWKTDVLRKPL